MKTTGVRPLAFARSTWSAVIRDTMSIMRLTSLFTNGRRHAQHHSRRAGCLFCAVYRTRVSAQRGPVSTNGQNAAQTVRHGRIPDPKLVDSGHGVDLGGHLISALGPVTSSPAALHVLRQRCRR